MKIDKKKEGLKYYQQGIARAKSIDAKYMLWIFYLDIYKLYLNEQNYNKALTYFILYSEVDKIIFNEKINNQIDQISTRYEEEKKKKEIVQKNNEIKLLQQEKRISNLKKLIVIIFLIIILIIGCIMFLQIRKYYLSQKEKLNEEIKFKNTDLTNFAISISNNYKFTETIKDNIKTLKKQIKDPQMVNQLDHIENLILVKLQIEKENNTLQGKVKDNYKSFYDNLEKSYPNLSKNEKNLAALLRLNLSSKEIATMFNLSVKNVEMGRYRLRKKLNISREENLTTYLNQF
jgi:DNA-binding CsgD family transcriptional regulator